MAPIDGYADNDIKHFYRVFDPRSDLSTNKFREEVIEILKRQDFKEIVSMAKRDQALDRESTIRYDEIEDTFRGIYQRIDVMLSHILCHCRPMEVNIMTDALKAIKEIVKHGIRLTAYWPLFVISGNTTTVLRINAILLAVNWAENRRGGEQISNSLAVIMAQNKHWPYHEDSAAQWMQSVIRFDDRRIDFKEVPEINGMFEFYVRPYYMAKKRIFFGNIGAAALRADIKQFAVKYASIHVIAGTKNMAKHLQTVGRQDLDDAYIEAIRLDFRSLTMNAEIAVKFIEFMRMKGVNSFTDLSILKEDINNSFVDEWELFALFSNQGLSPQEVSHLYALQPFLAILLNDDLKAVELKLLTRMSFICLYRFYQRVCWHHITDGQMECQTSTWTQMSGKITDFSQRFGYQLKNEIDSYFVRHYRRLFIGLIDIIGRKFYRSFDKLIIHAAADIFGTPITALPIGTKILNVFSDVYEN